MPAKSRSTRPAEESWVADASLCIELGGGEQLRFDAGDPCVGAPQGWPPQWVIDAQLVHRNPTPPDPADTDDAAQADH